MYEGRFRLGQFVTPIFYPLNFNIESSTTGFDINLRTYRRPTRIITEVFDVSPHSSQLIAISTSETAYAEERIRGSVVTTFSNLTYANGVANFDLVYNVNDMVRLFSVEQVVF